MPSIVIAGQRVTVSRAPSLQDTGVDVDLVWSINPRKCWKQRRKSNRTKESASKNSWWLSIDWKSAWNECESSPWDSPRVVFCSRLVPGNGYKSTFCQVGGSSLNGATVIPWWFWFWPRLWFPVVGAHTPWWEGDSKKAVLGLDSQKKVFFLWKNMICDGKSSVTRVCGARHLAWGPQLLSRCGGTRTENRCPVQYEIDVCSFVHDSRPSNPRVGALK